MTQKERMLSELPYKAWMDGLSDERAAAKRLVYEYNHLHPDENARRDRLRCV